MGEFTKNTTITLLARILNLVIGVATSVIIARLLGPEGKGIYSLAILFPTLITTFTNIGVAPATVYYIGQEKYSCREILGNNVVLSLVVGAISILIGLAMVFFFRDFAFSGVARFYLLLALALIPVSLSVSYLQCVFLGMQRILEFNLISTLKMVLMLALVAVSFWGFKASITGVLIARVATFLLISILLFFWTQKATGGFSFKPNLAYLKDISTYGLKAHLGNILAFLNYRFNMLLVNAYLDPLAVGFYSIAVTIAEQLWLISQSASTVLFPKVASEKDERVRKEFTPIVSRNVLLITSLGAAAAFFLSRWIVVFLYSADYLPAARPLQILLPGIVALSASRVLANDIAGRGRPMLNTYRGVVTVATNVFLNILWIPRYGIVGSAWASTVSYSVSFLLALFFYCRLSGNRWTVAVLPQQGDWMIYWHIVTNLWQRLKYVRTEGALMTGECRVLRDNNRNDVGSQEECCERS